MHGPLNVKFVTMVELQSTKLLYVDYLQVFYNY